MSHEESPAPSDLAHVNLDPDDKPEQDTETPPETVATRKPYAPGTIVWLRSGSPPHTVVLDVGDHVLALAWRSSATTQAPMTLPPDCWTDVEPLPAPTVDHRAAFDELRRQPVTDEDMYQRGWFCSSAVRMDPGDTWLHTVDGHTVAVVNVLCGTLKTGWMRPAPDATIQSCAACPKACATDTEQS